MRPTLAGRLVERFGRPDEMKALYADDIRWSLSRSLGPLAGAGHPPDRHPWRS